MLLLLKLIAFFGILGFFASKAIKKDKSGDISLSIPPILIGGALGVFAIFMLSSFGTIGAGERGVVMRFGAVTGKIVEPGLYWVTPFVESVHSMDVQVQKEEVKGATAVSKDLQQVSTDIALNYYPDPNAVARLYRTVGTDYKSRIIDPAIQEAVKAVTAKFAADSLTARRHVVKEMLTAEVTERLRSHDINVDAVNITNFAFTPEFTQAIEEKVTATQKALTAQNDLQRIKAEAQQQIETAKAGAEAIRIQAQAINAQGGRDYVALKAIEKWDGSVPQWITGNSSPIPFVNIAAPSR